MTFSFDHERHLDGFTPRTTCFGGGQSSDPTVTHPFGNLPNKAANQLYGSQLNPLLTLLGFGGGKQYGKYEGMLNSGQAQGPLANLIGGIQGFSGNVVPQATQVGNTIAGAAPQVYNDTKNAIQSAMSSVGGYQSNINAQMPGAASAVQSAREGVSDAYSPVRQSAMFQNTANRVLTPLRAGEAARGLESSGAGQAAETKVLEDLGLNQAQNEQQNRALAQSTYGGALGNVTNLAGAGANLAQLQPQIASQGYGNLTQYGNALSQRYMQPMSAAGALMNLLTAGQANTLGLTQATAPQVGQTSKGTNVL